MQPLPAKALTIVLVVLSGCGGDAVRTGPKQATSVPGSPAVKLPRVGECRGPSTQAIVEALSDPRPPIDCAMPHGSETVAVYELPPAMSKLSYSEVEGATKENADYLELIERCQEAARSHTGKPVIPPRTTVVYRANQLAGAAFVPTAEEWEKGGRWLRCDAWLPAPTETTEIATTLSFKNAAAGPVMDPVFRLCREEARGTSVECTRPHKAELMALLFDAEIDPQGAGEQGWRQAALSLFEPRCTEEIRQQIGAQREEVRTLVNFPTFGQAVDVKAQTGAIRANCFALTDVPVTGTLQAKGTEPLPQ